METNYLELNRVRGGLDVVNVSIDGSEYQFLLSLDGAIYAMSLYRVTGSWFEGMATLASGWATPISARRYIDVESGTVLFRGYRWQEEADNFPWLVELIEPALSPCRPR